MVLCGNYRFTQTLSKWAAQQGARRGYEGDQRLHKLLKSRLITVRGHTELCVAVRAARHGLSFDCRATGNAASMDAVQGRLTVPNGLVNLCLVAANTILRPLDLRAMLVELVRYFVYF